MYCKAHEQEFTPCGNLRKISFAVGANDQAPFAEECNEVLDVRCDAPFWHVGKSGLE